MEPEINAVAREIRTLMTVIDSDLDLSLSGRRGAKAAAKRARKHSLELERLLLAYRKLSVKEIG
ncbi:MAG: hypothetical protein ACOCQT_00205 [Desulfovermiculus sp.]